VTVCTNGVKPKMNTVYSGTYKPMSGQVTTVPKVYPTEVVCSGGLTTIWISHPEVTSGFETVTVTPTVRVPGYSKLLLLLFFSLDYSGRTLIGACCCSNFTFFQSKQHQ
jgi:hypothetical protein